jgi:sugar phosphate permease
MVFMGINGLFEAVGMPGSMGVLNHWFSKSNRGILIGMWAGCCNYGNIFGLISSTIITQYIGAEWVYNFFFNGVLAFSMAIMVLLFLRPGPSKIENINL